MEIIILTIITAIICLLFSELDSDFQELLLTFLLTYLPTISPFHLLVAAGVTEVISSLRDNKMWLWNWLILCRASSECTACVEKGDSWLKTQWALLNIMACVLSPLRAQTELHLRILALCQVLQLTCHMYKILLHLNTNPTKQECLYFIDKMTEANRHYVTCQESQS
jgi:hypothetical protein